MDFINKILKLVHKLIFKIRSTILAPISIYCFHQVSKEFDPSSMWELDWISIEKFKQIVCDLKKDSIFISLVDAQKHLRHDIVRKKNYVVLTCDDGYYSLREILPWLLEQRIPITLFINPINTDGKHYREKKGERYLTILEIRQFIKISNGLISIGMHGIEHKDVSTMEHNQFLQFLALSVDETKNIGKGSFIPFWAYTWGRHNQMTDNILLNYGIIPVCLDGKKNFNNKNLIHREILK